MHTDGTRSYSKLMQLRRSAAKRFKMHQWTQSCKSQLYADRGTKVPISKRTVFHSPITIWEGILVLQARPTCESKHKKNCLYSEDEHCLYTSRLTQFKWSARKLTFSSCTHSECGRVKKCKSPAKKSSKRSQLRTCSEFMHTAGM